MSAALAHTGEQSIVRYGLEHINEVRAELAQRSLYHFVKETWKIVEPATPFRPNWHIEAICEHLEAITRGQIKNLLINVPPRTGKSTVVSIDWPVWSWLPDESNIIGSQRGPGLKFMFLSYAETLAIDFAVSSRRLIQSPWFQHYFGHHFQFLGDTNRKTMYENTERGHRISQGVDGSQTGKGGDILCFDDPHKVKETESDVKRNDVLKWYDETMSSRLNDEATGHRVIIMQRCHQTDLSGHVLEQMAVNGFEHLNLPMLYEGKCVVDFAHKCSQPFGYYDEDIKGSKKNSVKLPPTSIGFKDPRTEEDEVLHEERFPPDVIAALKMMGPYAWSAQYQQKPGARKGNFFKVHKFDIWPEIYEDEVLQRWRAWDKAATEGAGCYTAGVRMGILAYYANGADEKAGKKTTKYFIDRVEREQFGPGKREALIKATAQLDTHKTKISVEQEPAAGGKESAEATKKRLAGYTVYLDNVSQEGSKELRADPYAVAVEMGQVILLEADWNFDFIEEHRNFPHGTYNDQVDAASQAFARNSRTVQVHVG